MRGNAIDANQLLVVAARDVVHGNHTIVDGNRALVNVPNGIGNDHFRRFDVDIGLDLAIIAAIQQRTEFQVTLEVTLILHRRVTLQGPVQVGINAVIQSRCLHQQINLLAVLDGISRLGLQFHLIGDAIHSDDELCSRDDLVALPQEGGIDRQVKRVAAL